MQTLSTADAKRRDLERDLATAAVLRDTASDVRPHEAAVLRSQAGLDASLRTRRLRGPRRKETALSAVPVRLVAAGALAAVLLALSLVLVLPGGGKLNPPTAEAVRIEGSISGLSGSSLTVVGPDGVPHTLVLPPGVALRDAFGNPVDPSLLKLGQILVVTGEQSNGQLTLNAVDLPDRLFGTVVATGASGITVRTATGDYSVAYSGGTEVRDPITTGSYVEIDIHRRPDGGVVAERVELEEHSGEDDDHDESSGPGNDDHDDDNDDHDGSGGSGSGGRSGGSGGGGNSGPGSSNGD
jgi:uncharacterized membrane protein YgcG